MSAKLARQPDVAADSAAGSATLRFEHSLFLRSRNRALPKRQRTRFLILAVSARHLQADPGHRPTVENIIDEAGLSRGTFYNHFKDMDDCIVVLLCTFLEEIMQQPKKPSKRSTYEAILEANITYCRAYDANSSLFAWFSELAFRDTQLMRMRERLNAEWVTRIVAVVAHRRARPFDDIEKSQFEGALRILVAMTIESLRERFVHEDPLLCQSFPTADSLAVALSQIWHQTMTTYESWSSV